MAHSVITQCSKTNTSNNEGVGRLELAPPPLFFFYGMAIIIFILFALALCQIMLRPKFDIVRFNGEKYLIMWHDARDERGWYRDYIVIMRL